MFTITKCLNSNHVINIDVIVIIKFNKVYGWLSLNLINNRAGSLCAILVLILHLPSNKTFFTSLSGFFCKIEKIKEVGLMCIFT